MQKLRDETSDLSRSAATCGQGRAKKEQELACAAATETERKAAAERLSARETQLKNEARKAAEKQAARDEKSRKEALSNLEKTHADATTAAAKQHKLDLSKLEASLKKDMKAQAEALRKEAAKDKAGALDQLNAQHARALELLKEHAAALEALRGEIIGGWKVRRRRPRRACRRVSRSFAVNSGVSAVNWRVNFSGSTRVRSRA